MFGFRSSEAIRAEAVHAVMWEMQHPHTFSDVEAVWHPQRAELVGDAVLAETVLPDLQLVDA